MADVNIEVGAQKEGKRHLQVYGMVHACGETVVGTKFYSEIHLAIKVIL